MRAQRLAFFVIQINIAEFSLGYIYLLFRQLLFLSVVFVRNCQLCAAFCTTCCQYATAVLCGHSLTETVLVLSLSVRGLECSFHCLIFLYVFSPKSTLRFQLAKLLLFFRMAKISRVNFSLFVINHGFVHCHAYWHRLVSCKPCHCAYLMPLCVMYCCLNSVMESMMNPLHSWPWGAGSIKDYPKACVALG